MALWKSVSSPFNELLAMPVAFSAEREKGENTSQLTYVTYSREYTKNCAANWLAYLEPAPPQNSLP